jgi:hypothetical protein
MSGIISNRRRVLLALKKHLEKTRANGGELILLTPHTCYAVFGLRPAALN